MASTIGFQFVDEIVDAMKTYCILNKEEVEFSRKKLKDGTIKVIIEAREVELNAVIRNEFDQEDNGYASFRLIFDERSNTLHTRTKFRAIIKKELNRYSGKYEDAVQGIEDIVEEYKVRNVKPTREYTKRRYSIKSNTYHFFEHTFKLHKLKQEDVMKLFVIFIKLKERDKVK
ncbi:hypothetical protein D3C71_1494790 [compost metagenome]